LRATAAMHTPIAPPAAPSATAGAETGFRPKGIVPTAEQLAIQLARRRHVLIEANAGAAKTTTLALRLAQALERGADTAALLALTYTDEAVAALKQALERIGIAAAVRNRLRIQTFDDFCGARLQDIEGAAVPRLNQPERLKPYVLQAIERVMDNPDERHRDEFAVEGTGEGMVEGLLDTFARLKGTMQLAIEAAERTPSPALAEELGMDYLSMRVWWAYEHLRRGGHPDHPAFRARHDATYDLARMLLDEACFIDLPQPMAIGLNLVLVDEMHDTNRAMFTVLKGLLHYNPGAAFIGVGDRDQVIHAVAGADARFMGDTFDEEIGVASRFPLTATYRFGPQLAGVTGRLAGKPYVSRSARETALRLIACEGVESAGWHIARMARQAAPTEQPPHARDKTSTKSRTAAADMAVLLRRPHQSVELENQLLDQGVDYRTVGFDTYLMRPEVLFVRGLFAHARGAFPAIEHADTRMRVLQALLLFTGSHVESEAELPADRQKDELNAVRQVAASPEQAAYGYFIDNQVLRNARPDARTLVEAALNVLRDDTPDVPLARFAQALKPHRLAARVMVRTDDIDQVEANIEGLVASAATYDNVESFFRAMNAREVRQRGMRGKDCLVLSSIEAAKGLEFEHVLMPGLDKGSFATGGPHMADDRNLLYVGMTRARQQLTLLYDPQRPSAYLHQTGLL
jgi:DNA helicase-2/ATP-dependent DNA helicase PcrA